MRHDSPLQKIFVREDLPGLPRLDDFGVRFSFHGHDSDSFVFDPQRIEGRLLIGREDPRRIVVVATEQFNLAGSPNSLMAFCRLVDETVCTMMAYSYSPEKGEWL